MSTGFYRKTQVCKIGKKEDKSDCAKKDCENCRHWILGKVWQDCLGCKNECVECPVKVN